MTTVNTTEQRVIVTTDVGVAVSTTEQRVTVVPTEARVAVTVAETPVTVATTQPTVACVIAETDVSVVVRDGISDHALLSGLHTGNPHPQYELDLGDPSADGYVLSSTAAGARSWVAQSAGVTDHGALSGLNEDDHPQYHTDARGDARYYTKTATDALLTSYLLSSNYSWSTLPGKPATFPPSTHTHAESDVTSLVSDLAAKATTSALNAHTSNTSNPHATTAAQVGALTQAQADALYAQLASANIFEQGPNVFRPGGAPNTMEWQSDAGDVLGRVEDDSTIFAPKIGIGNAAAFDLAYVPDVYFAIYQTVTNPTLSAGNDYRILGFDEFVGVNLPAGFNRHSGVYVYGANYFVSTDWASETAPNQMTGFQASLEHDGAGTADRLSGASVSAYIFGTGTATEMRGLYVDLGAFSGGANIDAAYGIKIEQQYSTQHTADYGVFVGARNPGIAESAAIYTEGGLVSLGDDQEFRFDDHGPILIDRVTAARFRLYVSGGALAIEAA